jgi:hypothetical protein
MRGNLFFLKGLHPFQSLARAGRLRGAPAPLLISSPLPLVKGKGIKGIGFIKAKGSEVGEGVVR